MIGRQAPVAGDLRLVTALLHVSRMVERMGDQCVNVAKLVTVTGPPPPGTEQLAQCVVQMGEQTLEAVRTAAATLRAAEPDGAEQLAAGDEALNALSRSFFTQAIELGADQRARAWATGTGTFEGRAAAA